MAAQFSMTFTLDAQSITQDSASYSSANGQRFLDWAWAAYPQFDLTDPDNPVPAPDTPANRAKSIRAAFDAIYAGIKGNVQRWEQQQAAETAVGNVPPIDPE